MSETLDKMAVAVTLVLTEDEVDCIRGVYEMWGISDFMFEGHHNAIAAAILCKLDAAQKEATK